MNQYPVSAHRKEPWGGACLSEGKGGGRMRTDIKHKLKVTQTQGSSVFAAQGYKLCEAPYVTFSLYYNVESYAKGVRVLNNFFHY